MIQNFRQSKIVAQYTKGVFSQHRFVKQNERPEKFSWTDMAVLNESTEWFNADTPEKPNHSLKPDDFEILEVEITFSCYKDRSHIANVHGER
jgi:hypothetical protein